MNYDPLRICALVVTYHPPPSTVNTIAVVRPQVGGVIVIDNGSPAEALVGVERMAAQPGQIELLRNDSNVGLATALNQGCRLAAERGFEAILFLDQDSEPFPTLVADLLNAWRSAPHPERVGVIGSNSLDDRGRPMHSPRPGKTIRKAPFVVTSGSLLPLRVFAEVGPFRDDFFIDCIDIEFCYRLESRGLRTLLCLKPTMRHCWGEPSRHRVLGVVLMATNHSPLRRYYIVRNGVYVATRYLGVFPVRCGIAFGRVFLDAALTVLLEDQKWLKTRAMSLGLWHGLFGRLGRAPSGL